MGIEQLLEGSLAIDIIAGRPPSNHIIIGNHPDKKTDLADMTETAREDAQRLAESLSQNGDPEKGTAMLELIGERKWEDLAGVIKGLAGDSFGNSDFKTGKFLSQLAELIYED